MEEPAEHQLEAQAEQEAVDLVRPLLRSRPLSSAPTAQHTARNMSFLAVDKVVEQVERPLAQSLLQLRPQV